MNQINRVLLAAAMVAAWPGLAIAECPEPTDTQGVEVIDGAFTVSQKVEIEPVLWVANAGEDTVSKVDTAQDKEVARYSTAFWGGGGLPTKANAWLGHAPSRSAVDTDGNAFVANRGFGVVASVMKIITTGCIDRNNNGTCETSTDLNGDGHISTNEMYPIIDDNNNGVIDDSEIRDERVVWVRQVGSSNEVARALAIDKDGDLWVGMYNTGNLYKMDATTGGVLGSWPTGTRFYGAAVDSKNRLFSAYYPGGSARRIDLTNPTAQANYYLASSYGMAIGRDETQKEWVIHAAHNGWGFSRQDPDTLAVTTNLMSGYYATYGISFDADGQVVLSTSHGYHSTGATKARTDGSVVWTRTAPAGCNSNNQRGAIVDANNDIWVVSLNHHKVCKYLSNGNYGAQLAVGRYPYTYSDASGIGLQYSDPTGKLSYQSDAGALSFDWTGGELCYDGGGNVTVTAAAADSKAGLDFANPQEMTMTEVNGQLCGNVPAGVTGQYLKITFTIKVGGTVVAGGGTAGECPIEIPQANEPPVALCIVPVTVSADASCQAALPSADNGSNDPDGVADIATLGQDPAAGTLVGLGSHAVNLTIADLAGESAACATVVTVADTTAPTADAGADQTGLEADASCAYTASSAGAGADNCAVASYEWTDAAGNVVGDTADFNGVLGNVGDHTYNLKTCDAAGNCSADSVTFSVATSTLACFDVHSVKAKSKKKGTEFEAKGRFQLNGCTVVDLAASGASISVDGATYTVPAGAWKVSGDKLEHKGKYTLTFWLGKGEWSFKTKDLGNASLSDGVAVELLIGDQVARSVVTLTAKGKKMDEWSHKASKYGVCAKADQGESDSSSKSGSKSGSQSGSKSGSQSGSQSGKGKK